MDRKAVILALGAMLALVPEITGLSGAPGLLPDAAAQERPGSLMVYEIVQGDTVYYDVLAESRVVGRRRRSGRKEWRRYTRLIYNFNKAYPYALVCRDLMAQADSTIAADVTRRSERNEYINAVERELLQSFEKDIRQMTISQGVLLLRLIDRECGKTGYDIIKEYESGFAAGFWQLIAKLFDQNLKSHYDPEGIDVETEELIYIWECGQWEGFYRSVFGTAPPKTEISKTRLETEVHKR